MVILQSEKAFSGWIPQFKRPCAQSTMLDRCYKCVQLPKRLQLQAESAQGSIPHR